MDFPIVYRWDGEHMTPLPGRHAIEADKQFVIGDVYRLAPHHDRSIESHRHEFAAIREAHKNLPEDIAAELPTAEHLRKRALIATGWCDVEQVVCESRHDANRLAVFARKAIPYCLVTINKTVVSIFVAKSQSMRAMGKKDFQQSKNDILDYCASLLDVTVDELKANADRSA